MSSSIITNLPSRETINQAEALKLTKQISGQNAQLLRYQFVPYNDKEFWGRSIHSQLVVDVKKNEESSAIERQSFFVKTISLEAVGEHEKRGFEREVTFYRDIVPQLMKYVDLGRWIPKCFLAKSDTLVLENLDTKGFSRRGSIFDEDTTKSALRSLARLHASSLLAEARLEKSLYELCPNAFQEMVFTHSDKNENWFAATLNTAIEIADGLSLNSTKIGGVFGRLQHIVAQEKDSLLNHETDFKVVSHRSLWSSNILFDDNQPPNCILVDYKCTGYASPAQDLLLLLYLCTTREFRQQHEQKMIEFYHSNLRTFAFKYNPAARVLSLDQMKREVEEQRLRAIVSAVFYLPTTLLTEKFAADVLKNPVEYEKFHNPVSERSGKIMGLMMMDQTYRQRIEEAVEELVDYSERCCN